MSGLQIPGPPPLPRSGRLLAADGRTLRTFTRHTPTSARLMPLDADGHPTGPGVELPVCEIVMTTDGTAWRGGDDATL